MYIGPSSDWKNVETYGDIIIAEPPVPVGGEIIPVKTLLVVVPYSVLTIIVILLGYNMLRKRIAILDNSN
jgi:hypothetical protein